MVKVTVQQVSALRPMNRPYKRTIDTGLQLRVATNGVKTWIVQYVVDGRQRDYRLERPYGVITDHAHLSLADARIKAADIRALARKGVDFQIQAKQEQAASAQSREDNSAAEVAKLERERLDNLSCEKLFATWIADGVRRKDGNTELRRSFNADILPFIGQIPIKLLTEHDLRAVLRAIVARNANRTAVILRNSLVQMFAWAEKRQPWRKLLSDGNPMELIEIEKIVSPEYDLNNQRDRILSASEICELRDIFARMRSDYDEYANKRFGAQPIAEATEIAVWIMLSTMCRVGEMSMARWEHVDLEKAKWFIPKHDVKGGRDSLDVFLSPFALQQFRDLHERTGDSAWCFPSRNHEGHLDPKAISKQVGDRQARFKKSRDGSPRKPMKNRPHDNTLVLSSGTKGAWTPHDLRRTGATMMQALGVPLEVIDRCQNHVLPGSKVRRHYLHHDYACEKREAWRILGERISSILG